MRTPIRANLPKVMYHGTSAAKMYEIIADGLKPRRETGLSNFEHSLPSNPNCVYLTTTYPIHFCFTAGKEFGDAAIFEIDTTRLKLRNLLPDEDFLEQATRGQPGWEDAGESMKERTEFFRDYAYARGFKPEILLLSLKGMGNLCHDGPIPACAISRVALIPQEILLKLLVRHFDGTVTIQHHKILGEAYRDGVHRIFDGGPVGEAAEIFGIAPPADLLAEISVFSQHDLRRIRRMRNPRR